MNKRQAKKTEKKTFLLGGLSYKEDKKDSRNSHEHYINYVHKHKMFNGFTEEEQELMEIGFCTKEEILGEYTQRKQKIRHRQLSKVN